MLQSQSAALELFIGLEVCWTYSVSDTGTLLHDWSSFLPLPGAQAWCHMGWVWKAQDIPTVRATCVTCKSRLSCFPHAKSYKPFLRHRGNITPSRLTAGTELRGMGGPLRLSSVCYKWHQSIKYLLSSHYIQNHMLGVFGDSSKLKSMVCAL